MDASIHFSACCMNHTVVDVKPKKRLLQQVLERLLSLVMIGKFLFMLLQLLLVLYKVYSSL